MISFLLTLLIACGAEESDDTALAQDDTVSSDTGSAEE